MKTILVVDDEQAVLQAVTDILSDKGYDIITAGNGKSGLKKIKEHRPDVILTDIIMPDMEGIEFIKAVRKEQKEIPIIVMSGNPVGMKFLKVAGIFGAAKSLVKPFTRQELLQAVEES
jgi:CheY-like chemotaxis protein